MPSAEEMAASLEAGESHDDQFMAGHGGESSILLNTLWLIIYEPDDMTHLFR